VSLTNKTHSLAYTYIQPTKQRKEDSSIGAGAGVRGIKLYPPSKIFAKLVNRNEIKHQKGVPSFPKFGKNIMDPLPGF